MAKYKAIMVGQKGIRYMKAEIPEDPNTKLRWKFVSKDNLPVNMEGQLTPGVELSDQDIIQVAPVKECIFCGAFGKLERRVNLQTVYLCTEHYYSESLGKIAAKLNEVTNHAQTKEEVLDGNTG